MSSTSIQPSFLPSENEPCGICPRSFRTETREVIDAAWDVDGVFAVAERNGWRITHALYTHGHLDHTGGDASKWGAPYPGLQTRTLIYDNLYSESRAERM